MTCSIIPPYLLQRVVETADRTPHPGERTLQLDAEFRRSRGTGRAGFLAATGIEARRGVHTAGNTDQLPGRLVRQDSDPPTGDAAVDEAWSSSAQIWELYAEVFGRESVDGNGSPVNVTVHFGQDYDNAFWNGQQLVFGDGDGEVFGRFTRSLDVMAHEFTHGVTENSAGLSYDGQAGALNESVSDVFASICKQRVNRESAAAADWLIGRGIFVPGIKAKALRSMRQPGTAYDDPRLGRDPQVDSMADYVDTADDNGGVHINSGIPNKAFCLTATSLGGNSWDQAGPIWYQALTGGEVSATTDFAGFAAATVNAAAKLYPDDPAIAEQVTAAWTEVGVLTRSTVTHPVPGPGRAASRTVAISRSGGVAGATRTAEVDLDTEAGRRISGLLDKIDFSRIGRTPAQPDRFVYRLKYGARQLIVAEQDLPPELHEAIKLAFARRTALGTDSEGRDARGPGGSHSGRSPKGDRGQGR